MPTKLGEHCVRCGAKSLKRVEEIDGKRKTVYECPNRHGVQLIEDAPAEPLPEEPEDLHGYVDNVGEAVNRSK